ncbi:MAG TPA: alpha/beta hydrolase [Bacteroidales bacterium]|mgnify:FL=1|nr:alpha/beta hydrolase [Bacteroidales bacterium]
MKKPRILFLICMVAIGLYSCDRIMETPEDTNIPEPKYFKEVLRDSTFTLTKLKDALLSVYPVDIGNNETLFKFINLLDSTRTVHSTAISYMTKDPRGNAILASGLIIEPVGQRSKGVVHFFPSAKIDKSTIGSEIMLTFEGTLGFFGYTVIIPDLVGYGVSDHVEYPFLYSDNTGQVSYDLHLAAAEYFQSIGRTFPKKVTLAGYSMGGMGVVALHRHIEQQIPQEFEIVHSYPGGGVYDLGKAVDFYKEHRRCEFAFLPYMYVSMNFWYDLNLDYSQIFIDPLLANMDDWLSRKYLSHEMKEFLAPEMDTYMHPDFFTPEGNVHLNKVDSCLRLHSVLDGWAPKAPMTIIHSVNDAVAPFTIAEEMYNNFRKKSNRVTLMTSTEDHFSYGIEYFASLLIYLTIK